MEQSAPLDYYDDGQKANKKHMQSLTKVVGINFAMTSFRPWCDDGWRAESRVSMTFFSLQEGADE
jgi:hypothetical protein